MDKIITAFIRHSIECRHAGLTQDSPILIRDGHNFLLFNLRLDGRRLYIDGRLLDYRGDYIKTSSLLLMEAGSTWVCTKPWNLFLRELDIEREFPEFNSGVESQILSLVEYLRK